MKNLFRRVLMLLAVCMPVSGFCAEEQDHTVEAERTVKDLPYGEILFNFYKQDYFTSLVHFLKADEQKLVPNHIEDAELLAGGIYLSYGMQEKAEKIFQQLLSEKQPQSTHDRAWYYLAKIAYQRGNPEHAVSSLDKIKEDLPGDLLGENKIMRALIAMDMNDHKAAIDQLTNWKGDKSLEPYVQYNLGVAELKSGQEDTGLKRLDELGRKKSRRDDESILALRDKANLAIGFYLLEKKKTKESRTYINRVRLEGPLSNQALLGAGWSDIENEAGLSALIPWQVLSERNVLDPLVQETMISIPLAWSKSGAVGRAAEAYERAIEVFSSEIDRLDQTMEEIRSGKFIDYLISEQEKIELGWMRDLKINKAAPEPFYMDDLLASHRTQESLKNYRDLWYLKSNLEHWQESINAYDDMLSLRWERFQLFVPQAKEKLEELNLEGYERQYQQLSEFYSDAVESEDWLAFATADELEKWDLLEAMQAQLNADTSIENYQEIQDRVTFYKGILLWQLNAAQPERRWNIRKQLGIISDELNYTRGYIDSINTVLLTLPAGFEGFDQRILADKDTIAQLLEKVDLTLSRQADVLVAQVMKILSGHRDRLDTLNLRAAFALAQIYDRAANPVPEKKQ